MVSCDGFDSNFSIPNYDRLAHVLSYPGDYICQGPLRDTVLGQVLKKRYDASTCHDDGLEGVKAVYGAISDTYKKSSELNYALDDKGLKVIQTSRKNIEAHFNAAESPPTLLTAAAKALDMAANIAIMCLSEDNVSCETLLVT